MISHLIPYRGAGPGPCPGSAGADAGSRSAPADGKPEEPARLKARDGPVRFELRVAPRFKGTRVDPGAVSCSAREGRLPGTLLLPRAGQAGARCWWECADGGDRNVDQSLSSLFGGA